VQGRYDLLCPPATSFALAQTWPQAEIVMAEVSGHNLHHPAVHQHVKAAIARFRGDRFGLT
jgi:proline iminopeptidase